MTAKAKPPAVSATGGFRRTSTLHWGAAYNRTTSLVRGRRWRKGLARLRDFAASAVRSQVGEVGELLESFHARLGKLNDPVRVAGDGVTVHLVGTTPVEKLHVLQHGLANDPALTAEATVDSLTALRVWRGLCCHAPSNIIPPNTDSAVFGGDRRLWGILARNFGGLTRTFELSRTTTFVLGAVVGVVAARTVRF